MLSGLGFGAWVMSVWLLFDLLGLFYIVVLRALDVCSVS